MKLPQPHIPTKGLYDVFISHMATAMGVSEKEAEVILRKTR